jgi:hypothetical protein
LVSFIALDPNRLWTKHCTAAASRRIAKIMRPIPQKRLARLKALGSIHDWEFLRIYTYSIRAGPQDPRQSAPAHDFSSDQLRRRRSGNDLATPWPVCWDGRQ